MNLRWFSTWWQQRAAAGLFALPCRSCLCTLGGRLTAFNFSRDTWTRLAASVKSCIRLSCFSRAALRCWSLGPGRKSAQTTAACLTRSQCRPLSSNRGCCAATAQVSQRRDGMFMRRFTHHICLWFLCFGFQGGRLGWFVVISIAWSDNRMFYGSGVIITFHRTNNEYKNQC